MYCDLLEAYGAQGWWPFDGSHHEQNGTDPRFEIMAGAILTQNTNWKNVERALKNLKLKNMLCAESLLSAPLQQVAELIRPSGYYNQKAARLVELSRHIMNVCLGDMDLFFCRDTRELRRELLSINGIGPETADSILLYAGKKPVFVVDAYTKRLCYRLPLPIVRDDYETIRSYFESELSRHAQGDELTAIFNEFHALIVKNAKEHCRARSLCEGCPLERICNFSKQEQNLSR